MLENVLPQLAAQARHTLALGVQSRQGLLPATLTAKTTNVFLAVHLAAPWSLRGHVSQNRLPQNRRRPPDCDRHLARKGGALGIELLRLLANNSDSPRRATYLIACRVRRLDSTPPETSQSVRTGHSGRKVTPVRNDLPPMECYARWSAREERISFIIMSHLQKTRDEVGKFLPADPV